MPIDLFADDIVTLTDAAKRLPHRRRGKRPNPGTLHRWCTKGVRGVRLDYVMVGAVKCTSLQAIQNFCDQLTAAAEAGQTADAVNKLPGVSKRRQKEIEAAEQRLARAGI